MKKNYIKPLTIVVKVETETLLVTFSQEGNGGVGITPDTGDIITGGDADAKDDGGSGDIWGDEW